MTREMKPNSYYEHLRTDKTALELPDQEFRRLGHDLVDRIATFLSTMRQRPVTPAETVAEVRAAVNAELNLPEHGADAGVLLQRASELLFNHSLLNGHPRFWGYITSSAAQIGRAHV